jgi:REP-associated tyrosine transposase
MANARKGSNGKRSTPKAALLPFSKGRGGRRRGAGRKPKGAKAGVSHRARAELKRRFPVHVTVKLKQGLPKLRQHGERASLLAAFAAGCDGTARSPGAFRLCHFAILNDHLHFIVEAEDRTSLSRGLQGLLVRLTRALNKLWGRKGKVLSDRYHDHILKTPREVRNAIRYVLANGKKHAAEGCEVSVPQPIDTCSSAPWFDGFIESITVRHLEGVVRPVTDARTWLLNIGWRKHGLLSVFELPATA